MIDEALRNPHGETGATFLIKTFGHPVGTSRGRALWALRDHDPRLHERWRMSCAPHAAVIEAGFRKRAVIVPLEPVSNPGL